MEIKFNKTIYALRETAPDVPESRWIALETILEMEYSHYLQGGYSNLYQIIEPTLEKFDPRNEAELFIAGLWIGNCLKGWQQIDQENTWASYWPKLENLTLEEQKIWLEKYRSAMTAGDKLNLRNEFMKRINDMHIKRDRRNVS